MMIKKIILLLFFIAAILHIHNSEAKSSHNLEGIVKVKKLYIETEKAIKKKTNNNFYLVKEKASYFINLGLDLDFNDYLYFNQKINTIVGEQQFRHVGYDLEAGVRAFRGIDLYLRHFSGHALDTNFGGDFPEDNSVGLRFIFIGNR